VLNLAPQDDLDAERFEAHVRRGRDALDSRPAEALATFDEALAWWRGRALEEFAHEPFALPAAARLEELRQATHEGRAEALLALGRHDEALVELEALIARFPLRERFRELQMLALYRAGRQGDALQAIQAARRTLAEELGVDPGPALVSLEQAILSHDPSLEAPAREPGERIAQPLEAGAPARRRWIRPAALAAIAMAVIAVVAVGTAQLAEEDEDPGPTGSPGPPSVNGSGEIHWTETPPQGAHDLGGPGDQVIVGGTATDVGLVAVGYTAAERTPTERRRNYDAAVWAETDPEVWELVADAAFAAPGNQRAADVVTIAGRIVVVGTDDSPGDFDAAVWTLDDGSALWARVAPDTAGIRERGDQTLRAATWDGSHVVAVGFSRRAGDEDAAMWLSSDGDRWTFQTPSNLDEPGDQEMTTVTTLGSLVVAGGFTTTSEGTDAAIWISSDPVEWRRVSDPSLGDVGDQQINAVVAGGPGLIAVGQETVDGDQDAVVWTSVNGSEWDRVEDPEGSFGGPGAQQMSAIVGGREILIAAGSETLGRETDGAVWTSVDGSRWVRLTTSLATSALTDFGRSEGVRDLLATEDRFIALGRERRGQDDDANVWIGQLRD
jgi:DNA-binding SARP family transcriptional activator